MKEIIARTLARLGMYEDLNLVQGMAQVGPKVTQVPVWIQIQQKPDGSHKEPTIKVRLTDGKFKERKGTSVVTINNVRVIQGDVLSASVLRNVTEVIERSKPQLIDYWEGSIDDTQDVIDAMRP